MIKICYLLNKAIQSLVEKPWYGETTKQDLVYLFINQLSQILKLGFDLSIDKHQLEVFQKRSGLNPSVDEYIYFLIGTLEQESTYILVNYYQVLFIKALFGAVQKEHLTIFENTLIKYDVTASLVSHVDKLYREYVIYRNKLSSSILP